MANGTPPPPPVPGMGWVDVASRAVTQVGFPVVIAGVLLWFVLGRFQDNMTMISTRMATNADAIQRLVGAEDAMLVELRLQTETLKRIAQDLNHLTVRRHEEKP